ncbi:hypothetical protein ACFE04_004037 [Oxalis oulophora]
MARHSEPHLILTIRRRSIEPNPNNDPSWLVFTGIFPMLFNATILYHLNNTSPKPYSTQPLYYLHLIILFFTVTSATMNVAVWLFFGSLDSTKSPRHMMNLYLYRVILIWRYLGYVHGCCWFSFFGCLLHLVTLVMCYMEFRKVDNLKRRIAYAIKT